MSETITINSLQALAAAITRIDEEWHREHYLEVVIKRRAKQRTDQQRKAIEVFCRELADVLNDAGLDQRAVMAKMEAGFEVPWRQETVKENLWRPVQVAAIGKESTTKLTIEEVSKVYDPLNRWLAEKFGLSVPFPARERE
jgi:hypothetical protein